MVDARTPFRVAYALGLLLALYVLFRKPDDIGKPLDSSSTPYRIVLVTVPSSEVADTIGAAAVERNLASCVNVLPGVTSHYMWEGKLEKSQELMMVIKSIDHRIKELELLVEELHPYDVPEFLVIPVSGGSQRYLDFLKIGTSDYQ